MDPVPITLSTQIVLHGRLPERVIRSGENRRCVGHSEGGVFEKSRMEGE